MLSEEKRCGGQEGGGGEEKRLKSGEHNLFGVAHFPKRTKVELREFRRAKYLGWFGGTCLYVVNTIQSHVPSDRPDFADRHARIPPLLHDVMHMQDHMGLHARHIKLYGLA